MRLRMIRHFLRLEASAGIILFFAAIVALVVDNSPLASLYQSLLATQISFHIGNAILGKSLLLWINEGLMTFFFMLVGLEIKRELLQGELNSRRKALLPIFAAIGGMIGPAAVYCFINWGDPTALRGWAIPTATDIAFALGILALLGSRVPTSLKIFLTALAIFDDIGGIAIIAGYYTHSIAYSMLVAACVCIALLILLNRLNICSRWPYFLVGALLWFFVLKSGIHATLAGIIVALLIPIEKKNAPEISPLRTLEHSLHPWVAYLVLPLFAFTNAGISFAGLSLNQLWQPIPLGIAVGLCIANPISIWLSSIAAIKLKWARKPHGATWLGLFGVSMVAGVGFTMSLFIGSLAFDASKGAIYAAYVRLGVLEGSVIAGIIGFLILRFGHCQSHELLHNSEQSDNKTADHA
jgi:Na+:H+ antiporter, NhaA family